MDDILATILKNTYSLSSLKHRLRVLKTYLTQQFFGSTGETPPPLTEDLNWLKSLPPDFYQKFTKDNVYDTLATLDKTITGLQMLTIYLTFEPDEATLNELGTKARATFGLPALLLDIKLDPALIAGAALSWKGRLQDYSLRAKLAEKRSEISESFRRFLR